MIRRSGTSLLAILIAFDELVQALLRTPIYVLTGRSQPHPRETISAWVGMMAAKRWPVGLAAQAVIDELFGEGHCARAAGHEAAWDTPV